MATAESGLAIHPSIAGINSSAFTGKHSAGLLMLPHLTRNLEIGTFVLWTNPSHSSAKLDTATHRRTMANTDILQFPDTDKKSTTTKKIIHTNGEVESSHPVRVPSTPHDTLHPSSSCHQSDFRPPLSLTNRRTSSLPHKLTAARLGPSSNSVPPRHFPARLLGNGLGD